MKKLKPLMLTKDPLNGYRSNRFGDHDWEPWQIEKFELLRPYLSEKEWEIYSSNVEPKWVKSNLGEETPLGKILTYTLEYETVGGYGKWARVEERIWTILEGLEDNV